MCDSGSREARKFGLFFCAERAIRLMRISVPGTQLFSVYGSCGSGSSGWSNLLLPTGVSSRSLQRLVLDLIGVKYGHRKGLEDVHRKGEWGAWTCHLVGEYLLQLASEYPRIEKAIVSVRGGGCHMRREVGMLSFVLARGAQHGSFLCLGYNEDGPRSPSN